MIEQKPSQNTKLKQGQYTTAHIIQAMTLLKLNNQQLKEKIDSEIDNPALIWTENSICPSCGKDLGGKRFCLSCANEIINKANDFQDPVVMVSVPTDNSYETYAEGDYSDPYEEMNMAEETLPEFILKQITSDLVPEYRLLAAQILFSLDDDGFFTDNKLEIARYANRRISEVDEVLEIIRKCEPFGVGAKNPQHAVLIQLEMIGKEKPIDPLIKLIITSDWELLTQKKYKEISVKYNISIAKVKKLLLFINENFTPHPARTSWGDSRIHKPSPTVRYSDPDVIINKQTHEGLERLFITIVAPTRRSLKIDPKFKLALKMISAENSAEYRGDLQKAQLLLKCISQRNNTIVQLMEKLAVLQRKFILEGEDHIKPLTQAALSKILDVNESTISRAVSSKTVQLPGGKIIPISNFFDKNLHIRREIRKIIAEETIPLNDTKLGIELERRGHKIARRTVAKYRSIDNIPPANKRKKI
jgi:RNA polymerase sigma-54 factor